MVYLKTSETKGCLLYTFSVHHHSNVCGPLKRVRFRWIQMIRFLSPNIGSSTFVFLYIYHSFSFTLHFPIPPSQNRYFSVIFPRF